MIFDGQNAIHNTMRILHQRLDEIVGRQERTLSQITMIQTGAAGGGQAQPHVCTYNVFISQWRYP